jgi:hypothetical protein
MPGIRPKPTSNPTSSEHNPAPGTFRRARLDAMPTAPPVERVTNLLRVFTAPAPTGRP